LLHPPSSPHDEFVCKCCGVCPNVNVSESSLSVILSVMLASRCTLQRDSPLRSVFRASPLKIGTQTGAFDNLRGARLHSARNKDVPAGAGHFFLLIEGSKPSYSVDHDKLRQPNSGTWLYRSAVAFNVQASLAYSPRVRCFLPGNDFLYRTGVCILRNNDAVKTAFG